MKFDKEQLRALAIMNNQTLDTLEFEMLNEMEDMLDEENKEKKLLQQRIDKVIDYMNNYIKIEPNEYSTTSAVKAEFEEILKLLKGEE